MGSSKDRRGALRGHWILALVAFLISGAPTARKIYLRQHSQEVHLGGPSGAPKGFWVTLQQQAVAADASRSVSSEYLARITPEQQSMCERFALVCLGSSSSNSSSKSNSSSNSSSRSNSSSNSSSKSNSSSNSSSNRTLRGRVEGQGLREMMDFALAAPALLTSTWMVFTELVLQLGIQRDKYLSYFAALQQHLSPFLLPPDGADADVGAAAATAADAAAATAAAAAAEGTEDGVDMGFIRLSWTELQQLAEEEQQLANTYLSLAAEGALFHSPPDDCLWAALLQQIAAKAAATAAAAKQGLNAAFQDFYHEAIEGYAAAFAAIVAGDDGIRLLLLQQQDTYTGSHPVSSFMRAILLSFCHPGECNGEI